MEENKTLVYPSDIAIKFVKGAVTAWDHFSSILKAKAKANGYDGMADSILNGCGIVFGSRKSQKDRQPSNFDLDAYREFLKEYPQEMEEIKNCQNGIQEFNSDFDDDLEYAKEMKYFRKIQQIQKVQEKNLLKEIEIQRDQQRRCLKEVEILTAQERTIWEELRKSTAQERTSLERVEKIPTAQERKPLERVEKIPKVQGRKNLKEIEKIKKDNQDSNFDFSPFLKSLEKVEKIKQMSIEELIILAKEIHEPRLLFPRTADEIDDFEKVTELWGQTINKISKLGQEIVKLKENDYQTDEKGTLTQNLFMINQSLAKIDCQMTQFCAVYQYFPLQNQDSLLLIYDFLEEKKSASLKGIFIHEGTPALLEPSLFPKELSKVSSSEHFTGLLKNAHITMKIDPKDLTKSTFSIIQGCPGGGIKQFLNDFKDSVFVKMNVVFILASKLFKKFGSNISASQLKSSPGAVFGVLLFGPLIAIGIGAYYIFGGKKRREVIKKLYEEALELDYHLDEAKPALSRELEIQRQVQAAREELRERKRREQALIGQI